jgi:hypothetical protein
MKRGNSKAVAWTPRPAHDSKAFQVYCPNARVKTSAPTNVGLTSINRSDHFPFTGVIRQFYKIVRLDGGRRRNLRCRRYEGNLSTTRRPPGG